MHPQILKVCTALLNLQMCNYEFQLVGDNFEKFQPIKIKKNNKLLENVCMPRGAPSGLD